MLSRNVENDDQSSYIDGIMANEDATLVKFSDRISNMKDLITWIRQEKGFTVDSLYTTIKYLNETEEMLNKVLAKYPDLFQSSER